MEAETREILTRARALIEAPERWCRHMLATDVNGRRCEATDTVAARWSSNGAVDRVDSDFAKEHNIIVPAGAVTTDFGAAGYALLGNVVRASFSDRTRPSVREGKTIEVHIGRLWEVNDYIGHAETLFVFDTVLAGTV